jgi:hypothetical protein
MAAIADDLWQAKAPTPEDIRKQLRSVLSSPVFQGSRRCKQFLEYVCEQSLEGNAETLKERTIAVEVFGRQPQSDLGEDTIVRVGAREVRKRLAQYYVTAEGLSAAVHIDLLPGSYAPEFRYASAAPGEAVESSPALTEVRKISASRWKFNWIFASLVIVVVLGATVYGVTSWNSGADAAAFDRFWGPVFQSPEPLLLAVASPIVYHPSLRARLLSESNQAPLPVLSQRPIQVPPEKLDGSDMIPVQNQYVGFGDMVVATEIVSMLAGKKNRPLLRPSSGIQFADMRQSQTLLIGAITNHWTMELSQSWRFQFARNPGLQFMIVDTMAPRGNPRQWLVPSQQDGSANEDYTLICRIRNSVTGRLVLVAAGLKQFGTEAAGRLIADPVQLSKVLSRLPRGWEDKNMQLVLHARVIGNTPGQPEVVAWHVW